MKRFDRAPTALFLAALLAACKSLASTPTLSPTDIRGTAIATISTGVAATQKAMPSATPPLVPLATVSPHSPMPPAPPTATPLVFTDPSVPLSARIVYYYFVTAAENPAPEGTVSWGGLLAPTYADEVLTPDTAADLRTALAIVLDDGRNHWVSDKIEIVEATFGNGQAGIVLQGEYSGLGDGVLCAASLQVLFTVFANPTVETATVTLNEGLIGNLCLFGPPTPYDYLKDAVYTRSEIEAFMQAIAYGSPVPSTPLPTDPGRLPTPTFVPGRTASPTFPPIESFVGIWHRAGSNPQGWPKIVIASQGGTLFANIRYACELPAYWTFPKDCELGLASARYTGNPVLMLIDAGSETYHFTLSLVGDTLRVTTVTGDAANSGTAGSTHEADYRKEVPSFPVSDQIIFYHFPDSAHGQLGAVRTPILLFPAVSDQARAADTAADLRTALELVLHDQRNGWISRELGIVEVVFGEGHAAIVLQGEYSGESDDVLTAARLQILLTVFANPAVQTAAVTLNGDTLANLGLSTGTNANPAADVFTRAEMETYLIDHYYSLEWGEFLDRQ